MAKRTIKVRLFSYMIELPIAGDPQGRTNLFEQTARFGETIDIPREEDIAKGEKHNAFFSKEEAKAVEAGTYTGPGYEQLRTTAAVPLPPSAAGMSEDDKDGTTGFDASDASSEQIAGHILANELTIPETIALAGDDKELAEKVLDAEAIVAAATQADPRKGVNDGLSAIMAAPPAEEETTIDQPPAGDGSAAEGTKPTVTQLTKQILDGSLNVEKTAALIGDTPDADMAKRVLSAEAKAAEKQGRDVRVGVERLIEATLSRANQ